VNTEYAVYTSSGIASGPYPTLKNAETYAAELAAFHGGIKIIHLPPETNIMTVAFDDRAIYIATNTKGY
jgi:hypothetical protein